MGNGVGGSGRFYQPDEERENFFFFFFFNAKYGSRTGRIWMNHVRLFIIYHFKESGIDLSFEC